MGQLYQLRENYTDLLIRAKYMQIYREFFCAQKVLPVDTIISETSKGELLILDERRVNISEKLGKIFSPFYEYCSECNGVCCSSAKDYFRATDYWLRRYSGEPLESFGTVTRKSFSVVHRLRNGVRNIERQNTARRTNGGCAWLGNNGCELPLHQRPIYCIVWTCERIRSVMGREERKVYLGLITDLYDILRKVSRILATEINQKGVVQKAMLLSGYGLSVLEYIV